MYITVKQCIPINPDVPAISFYLIFPYVWHAEERDSQLAFTIAVLF